jgi:hypothetical protein
VRCYKVASIESGAMHLACQLIAGKLVQKNQPTQISGFAVELAGKCLEGLQMNWVKYLVNQLEVDCREAHPIHPGEAIFIYKPGTVLETK